MKKTFLLVVFSCLCFVFSSCSKTHTCVCTTVDTSGLIDAVTVLEDEITASRSVAESLCDGGNTTNGTFVTTCELD